MLRNRWETAIRCLEIAVHPNTSDDEVVAAINGFRRTAGTTPLSELSRELAGRGAANSGSGSGPLHLLDRLDQVNRENRALRRQAAESDAGRIAALRRTQRAEQRAEELAAALLAAEHRADMAEQRLAEFRGAYGRISGGLQVENLDLRRALDEARHNLAQPIHEPVPPFQNILKAARQRPDQAATDPAPMSNTPWTA